ncbi:MAG: heme exporter protein CcmB [Desulfovibrionaceae bacterium]|nr:heme exporter protein CcmB [Desulfovibrionaceae bacterium]
MIRAALSVAGKDFRLIFMRSTGFAQAFLFGLLLVFVLSLSRDPGAQFEAQNAAAIFWLISLFCQTVCCGMLFAVEEQNHAGRGLLLTSVPVQSLWLGKMIAGFCFLLGIQLAIVPALVIFLNMQTGPLWGVAVVETLLCDLGLALCGSLLGALSQGHGSKDMLFSAVLFPFMLPILLAGIRAVACGFGQIDFDTQWLGLTFAFDAVFAAAGLILFPFVFSGE